MPKIVGLIPARSGSKRVKRKNIRPLSGHPLIAYTISAALQCDIFETVFVSTEDQQTSEIAKHYGAEVSFLRPGELATDTSPDIGWVTYTLNRFLEHDREFECFSILRPTNPFRQPETIQRAWAQFGSEEGVHSLRAVEKVTQHPGKMWVLRGKRMFPLLPLSPPDRPWHSIQHPDLPEVYIQNASLEIALSKTVFETKTIAGHSIMPFLTKGYEGFDINNPFDWWRAEYLIKSGSATLPPILKEPYPIELIEVPEIV